jgi:hypothetical protein
VNKNRQDKTITDAKISAILSAKLKYINGDRPITITVPNARKYRSLDFVTDA